MTQAFKRLIMMKLPIRAVQALCIVVAQLGQGKNDSVNAMATANADWDGYRVAQAMGDVSSAARLQRRAGEYCII